MNAKQITTSTTAQVTYVVRDEKGVVTDSRTSPTMAYTHANVGKDGTAYTWHTSEALARKATQPGQHVVAVEAHKGTKAAVLRRLDAGHLAAPAKAEKPALAVVEGGKAKATTKAKAAPKAKATTKAKAAPKATTKAAAPKRTTPPVSAVKGVQHPGAVLLALMEKAGTSQTKTATTMGVAPMTLNRLCNGHGIPTAKIVVLFAKAVGADPREVWAAVAEYELALALAGN